MQVSPVTAVARTFVCFDCGFVSWKLRPTLAKWCHHLRRLYIDARQPGENVGLSIGTTKRSCTRPTAKPLRLYSCASQHTASYFCIFSRMMYLKLCLLEFTNLPTQICVRECTHRIVAQGGRIVAQDGAFATVTQVLQKKRKRFNIMLKSSRS